MTVTLKISSCENGFQSIFSENGKVLEVVFEDLRNNRDLSKETITGTMFENGFPEATLHNSHSTVNFGRVTKRSSIIRKVFLALLED
jgi:hypothetical protein